MPAQTKNVKSSTKKNSTGLNKKAVLIGVVGLLIVIVGVALYALSQNNGANAAGGWTSLGTSTVTANKKVKITATSYACKVAVPKKGYKVKSYSVITSSTNTAYAVSARAAVGSGFSQSAKGNSIKLKGQKSTSPITTVAAQATASNIKAYGGIVPTKDDSSSVSNFVSKPLSSVANC